MKNILNKVSKTLFGSLSAMTLLMMTFPIEAFAKPKKITVGYLNLVNAQLVTKNLGLIQKEMPGVEVEHIKVGGGGDMLRAIAAKQVDFGGLGNPPTAIGVTRKLPIDGIMVLNMLDFVEAMVVRTDANIKSFKDLKGKTVAAPFGSTTHYLLLQALADEGIDPSSMTILDLRPNDIAAAWARGDLDAAWFWEPNLDKTVKRGGNIFMTYGKKRLSDLGRWSCNEVVRQKISRIC